MHAPQRPIILLGLRGSGKSTVGPLVAARLGLGFVDLDDRTRAALGAATVREAWANAGEPAFRKAEAGALAGAIGDRGVVLSLGGGTPTAPGAADMLIGATQAGALILYLRADPATLAARLRASGADDRPSLTGGDPADESAVVFAARDPLYRRVAGVIVECGQRPAGAIVDEVCRLATPGTA